YTKTELEQIGQHIAQVTLELEKETSEHFKAEHRKQYQAHLDNASDVPHLSPKEFSKVLKYAVETQELQPVLAEVKTRLDNGKLSVQDLYLLVFQVKEESIHQKVLSHLSKQIQDASSIIAMAVDWQAEWQRAEYVELSQSSPFTVALEVTITEEEDPRILTTKELATHGRKQEARHQASLLWIEAYLQNALLEAHERSPLVNIPTQVVEATATGQQTSCVLMHRYLSKPLKDGQNFVGMLNDICQSLRWDLASYEFAEVSEGFECDCRLQVGDEVIVGKGIAPAKQKAKAIAARQVMEKLQAIARCG
ncbi:MAG TPA: putative dsRNA-binding protein, partial [Stenomitos sp.]